METAKGTVGGWGLVLAIAAGLWVGCSPRTEIGEEPDGRAGATDDGSLGGSSGNTGGTTGGISGNAGQGGSDMLEPADGCFDLLTADGPPLQLGPGNQVLATARRSTNAILNYADEVVFAPPNWQLTANFPPSARSDDTNIQLPDELGQIPENVGEVHITRPACAGVSAAGRTLRVYAWWELGGAIVRTPTEGIALGTTDGESFADSTSASLVGDSQVTRALNTRSRIVLEHTFSASDDIDAGNVVLKLWLLENFELPTTLYVNRVQWE